MRSSTIWLGALGSSVLGIILIVEHKIGFGLFLLLFLAPCLFLYPVIRSIFFGGRDSVAAAITTVLTEEVIKAGIKNKIENRHRKKRQ